MLNTKEQIQYKKLINELNVIDMSRAKKYDELKKNPVFIIQHIQDVFNQKVKDHFFTVKKNPECVIKYLSCTALRTEILGGPGLLKKPMTGYKVTVTANVYNTTSSDVMLRSYVLETTTLTKNVENWLTSGNIPVTDTMEIKKLITKVLVAERDKLKAQKKEIEDKLKALENSLK